MSAERLDTPRLGLVALGLRPATGANQIPEGRPAGRARRRDAIYRSALALADVVAAALALVLVFGVLGDDRLSLSALVPIPVVVLVSKVVGLYDRDEHLVRKATLEEGPALLRMATVFAVVLWLLEDPLIVSPSGFGRDQLAALWVLLLVFMLAARAGARRLAGALAPEERCLVVGDADATALVRRKLAGTPGVRVRIVGRVPLESHLHGGDLPSLGSVSSLGAILGEHEVERVIVAPTGSTDPDALLDAIRLVRSLGVKVSILPRLFEVVGSAAEFDDLAGVTLLGIRRHGLTRSSLALKRGVDLFGATLGMVLLSPLLLAIALAIRLTSGQGVLVREHRIGREDREFEMLRFRTVTEKPGAEPVSSSLGRLLRRSSLHELPQLLNVLRGEMSLVGPRPLVSEKDREITGWQRRRLLVPPGMTGPWQILGFRVSQEEMVKIDYLYGASWSLWLDLGILLRTMRYVIGRQRRLARAE